MDKLTLIMLAGEGKAVKFAAEHFHARCVLQIVDSEHNHPTYVEELLSRTSQLDRPTNSCMMCLIRFDAKPHELLDRRPPPRIKKVLGELAPKRTPMRRDVYHLAAPQIFIASQKQIDAMVVQVDKWVLEALTTGIIATQTHDEIVVVKPSLKDDEP